jgi:hypothetical protein
MERGDHGQVQQGENQVHGRKTMTIGAELDNVTSNPRKEKRREEDKRLMAYRRAIEDYRDSRALHEQVCDFPDLLIEATRDTWARP